MTKLRISDDCVAKWKGKGMIIKINQEFKLEKREIKNGEGRESSEVKNQWIINPNGVEKYWKWHSCHKKCKITCWEGEMLHIEIVERMQFLVMPRPERTTEVVSEAR